MLRNNENKLVFFDWSRGFRENSGRQNESEFIRDLDRIEELDLMYDVYFMEYRSKEEKDYFREKEELTSQFIRRWGITPDEAFDRVEQGIPL